MPRSAPHAPTCTVLSVGTPILIAAALRAGRRGADPADLAHLRAPLAALADRDPAAALVVVWLDAKLRRAMPHVDPGSSPLPKGSGGSVVRWNRASGSTADSCARPPLVHEVRS